MKTLLVKLASLILVLFIGISTLHAEDGSERISQYRLKQAALVSARTVQSTAEGFAGLIETQPTAAGPLSPEQSMQNQEPTEKIGAHTLKTRAPHRSQK